VNIRLVGECNNSEESNARAYKIKRGDNFPDVLLTTSADVNGDAKNATVINESMENMLRRNSYVED
jgi:hypothetical protein